MAARFTFQHGAIKPGSDGYDAILARLITLINDAYECESGDSGVAFKTTKRLHSDTDVCKITDALEQGRCILAWDGGSDGGRTVPASGDAPAASAVPAAADASPSGSESSAAAIPASRRVMVTGRDLAALVGVMVWEEHADAQAVYFGPFAVDPKLQGSGLGRTFLQEIETLARARGCKYIDIDVVNHRSDIIPWYSRHGFVKTGEAPFPAPERITRPCHFIIMRKTLTD